MAMETRHAEISNEYEKLLLKVDDLENRRCNLCLLGIPEGLEKGNPTKFIAGLLHEILGDLNGLEKTLVLEFHEKELIRLAREKGRLEFWGKQIFIFPDRSEQMPCGFQRGKEDAPGKSPSQTFFTQPNFRFPTMDTQRYSTLYKKPKSASLRNLGSIMSDSID